MNYSIFFILNTSFILIIDILKFESKYSYCLKWKQFYEVRAILQYKTIILIFLTVLKDLIITTKQIFHQSFST